MTSYISGTTVRTLANFTTMAGVATDPDTVTLKVNMNGSTSTPVPVHDGTGAYHYDITTGGWQSPQPQLVTVEWIGTGAVAVVQSDRFYVTAPPL